MKIYKTLKDVPIKKLKRYLKDECQIDAYDDLGAKSGKRRMAYDIERELKRRSRRKKHVKI